MYKERYQKEVMINFFRNRAIALWNDLPNKVIEALSIKSFEKRLDKHKATFNIKYNLDNCLDCLNKKSTPNCAGTGRRRKGADIDLESQAEQPSSSTRLSKSK